MPSEATVDRNAVWVAPSKPDLEIEVTTLPPIFVVGERADRYRLVKLLDGRHGISCAPDSGLLADLAGAAQRNWPDLCRYGYPQQYWLRRVALFFDSLQAEYAASRHLLRWAATADPDDIGLVDRLFPRCQVVRVLPERRPARSARTAVDLGSRRLSARYYQVTGADLTLTPDVTVAGVLGFLDSAVEVRPRP